MARCASRPISFECDQPSLRPHCDASEQTRTIWPPHTASNAANFDLWPTVRPETSQKAANESSVDTAARQQLLVPLGLVALLQGAEWSSCWFRSTSHLELGLRDCVGNDDWVSKVASEDGAIIQQERCADAVQ